MDRLRRFDRGRKQFRRKIDDETLVIALRRRVEHVIFPGRDQKDRILRILVRVVFNDDRSGSVYNKQDLVCGVQVVKKTAAIHFADGVIVLKKYLLIFDIIEHIHSISQKNRKSNINELFLILYFKKTCL